jgi:hypothetical protein
MIDVEIPGPYGSDPYRTTNDPSPPDSVTIPYTGQERMTLAVAGGLANTHLRIDPDATALLRIDPGGGAAPHVRIAGDELRVGVPASLRWWRLLLCGELAAPVFVLHPAVAWTIVVRGGLMDLHADLSAGTVAGLELDGGASHVELDLPRPTRPAPIRIRGGASRLRLRRPADVGVALAVSGGICSLRLDANRFDAIGGGARLSAGAVDTAPHYAIAVTGGASEIEIEPVS